MPYVQPTRPSDKAYGAPVRPPRFHAGEQRSRPRSASASTAATAVLAIGCALASAVAAMPAVAAAPGLPMASLAARGTRAVSLSVRAVPPVAADCSKDVTVAFNAWLAKVPNGSIIVLKRRGCYRSNGTILLANKRNVTVLGNGATIKASGPPACPAGTTSNGKGYCVIAKNSDGKCPSGSTLILATDECAWLVNRAQLGLDRGGGLMVRDLTLQGSNFTASCGDDLARSCDDAARQAERNLDVRGSSRVLIDNVHFKNTWGDALEASPGGTWDEDGRGAVLARNVTVRNSTVDTVGRQAFSCSGCKNMTVRNNTIRNVGSWVVNVEVEAKTWTGDMTLERNTYSKVYLGLIAVSPNFAPSTLGPIVV